MFMGLLSLPSYKSSKFKGQVTTFKNEYKILKRLFCKGYADIKPSVLIA